MSLPAYDPRALDATERRFWRELWEGAPAAVAAAHGIELRTFGPTLQATIVRGLAAVPAMNLLLGAAEADADELAAGLDWVEAAGVSCYVPVTPGLPGSAAAEALLARRGRARGYGWMKFVRDLAPARRRPAGTGPEPDGVEVVELGGAAADGALLGRLVAGGFGLPPWMGTLFEGVCGRGGWRCYAALVDGEPAGAAVLLLDDERGRLPPAVRRDGRARRGPPERVVSEPAARGPARGVRAAQLGGSARACLMALRRSILHKVVQSCAHPLGRSIMSP